MFAEVKMFCPKCEKEINDVSLHMRKIIIAQKIKEFRQKNNLTQSQFADLFGITPQCVSKWEREKCYPDITFLPILAEAMECRIDEFFA